MKVFICLEFNGIDCDDENADVIVESITQACEGMQKAWGASSCWVDDAVNDGLVPKQEAREEWFEEELMDGIDITTLSLPNDIRIVKMKGV